MEEREVEGTTKALSLIQQFANKFRFIDFTSHPGDIPGEAAGKGSNLGWAARKLSANYAMGQRRDVIITGIDGKLLLFSCPCFHFCRPFSSLPPEFLLSLQLSRSIRHHPRSPCQALVALASAQRGATKLLSHQVISSHFISFHFISAYEQSLIRLS